MALLVTAADVEARIGEIDTSLRATDAAVKACPAGHLTDTTLAQWGAFKKAWNAFVGGVAANTVTVPFTGQALATFNPYTVEAQLDDKGGWGDQALAWHDTIAHACGAQGPGPTPGGGGGPKKPWTPGETIAVSVAVVAVSVTLLVGGVYAARVLSVFR